ncbi:hypothetical protein CPB86DRAFT_877386 [Serendipita vermifera]|nr:hypothetical protein CPB86DRAFT_877386 [Serendipita vermifera]
MDRIPSELWAQIIEVFVFGAPVLVPDPLDCCRSPLNAVDDWISQDPLSLFFDNVLTAMLVCRGWKEITDRLRKMVFIAQHSPLDWTSVLLDKPLKYITQAHLVARISFSQIDRLIPISSHGSDEIEIQDFLQAHLDELQARILVGVCLKRLSHAVVNQGNPLFHLQAAKHTEPIVANEAFFSNISIAFPNLVYLECKLQRSQDAASSNSQLFLPHLKSLFLRSPFDTSGWSLPSLKGLIIEMNVPSTMEQPLVLGAVTEMLKTIRQFGRAVAFLGVISSLLSPPRDFDIWSCCPQLTGLNWIGGVGNLRDSNPPGNHPLQYLMAAPDNFDENQRLDFIYFLQRIPNLRTVSVPFLNWEVLNKRKSTLLSRIEHPSPLVSASKELEVIGIRFEDRKGRSLKEFQAPNK